MMRTAGPVLKALCTSAWLAFMSAHTVMTLLSCNHMGVFLIALSARVVQ